MKYLFLLLSLAVLSCTPETSKTVTFPTIRPYANDELSIKYSNDSVQYANGGLAKVVVPSSVHVHYLNKSERIFDITDDCIYTQDTIGVIRVYSISTGMETEHPTHIIIPR